MFEYYGHIHVYSPGIKVFAIYSHGSHRGHVTWTIYTNFRSPFLRMPQVKFGFDWLGGFRGEDV